MRKNTIKEIYRDQKQLIKNVVDFLDALLFFLSIDKDNRIRYYRKRILEKIKKIMPFRKKNFIERMLERLGLRKSSSDLLIEIIIDLKELYSILQEKFDEKYYIQLNKMSSAIRYFLKNILGG